MDVGEKKSRKGLAERIKEAASNGILAKKKSHDLKKVSSPNVSKPPSTNDFIKDRKVAKAYNYIEVHRMRENIVSLLKEKSGKTIAITAPKDNVGNTFLVCAIGLNITFFTDMNVLVVDANLRRPEIHKHFGFNIDNGVTEIISEGIDPLKAIKKTTHSRFSVITAGAPKNDISRLLNRSVIEHFVNTVKDKFDVVLFDTSPVLVNNRNNIDPSMLSCLCDATMVVVLDRKTRKPELGKTVNIINQAGGHVDGILYNHFLPEEDIKKTFIGKLVSHIFNLSEA